MIAILFGFYRQTLSVLLKRSAWGSRIKTMPSPLTVFRSSTIRCPSVRVSWCFPSCFEIPVSIPTSCLFLSLRHVYSLSLMCSTCVQLSTSPFPSSRSRLPCLSSERSSVHSVWVSLCLIIILSLPYPCLYLCRVWIPGFSLLSKRLLI